jgi:hypothetical protein
VYLLKDKFELPDPERLRWIILEAERASDAERALRTQVLLQPREDGFDYVVWQGTLDVHAYTTERETTQQDWYQSLWSDERQLGCHKIRTIAQLTRCVWVVEECPISREPRHLAFHRVCHASAGMIDTSTLALYFPFQNVILEPTKETIDLLRSDDPARALRSQ